MPGTVQHTIKLPLPFGAREKPDTVLQPLTRSNRCCAFCERVSMGCVKPSRAACCSRWRTVGGCLQRPGPGTSVPPAARHVEFQL
jgi:hypothetical protein